MLGVVTCGERWLFPHQRDGYATIGRYVGIVWKQRLRIGLSRHHVEMRGRDAVALELLAQRVSAIGREVPGSIADLRRQPCRRGMSGDRDAKRRGLERLRKPLDNASHALVGLFRALWEHRAAVLIHDLDVETLLGLLDHDVLG